MRVLVVEDQQEVMDLVTRALAKDGHEVTMAHSLAEADAAFAAQPFEVVVLDLGLPDGDGLDWCKRVRANQALTPILVLTAQGAVAKRVASLDFGADDFLAKPFAVAELRARVRALGRRAPLRPPPTHTIGRVRLDFTARRAHQDDREVPLTAREWRIVEFLVAQSGRLVSRTEILETVWGDTSASAASSLDVLIARIRKKLGADFIRTMRGEGYSVG